MTWTGSCVVQWEQSQALPTSAIANATGAGTGTSIAGGKYVSVVVLFSTVVLF
jgi:hypothetical protein